MPTRGRAIAGTNIEADDAKEPAVDPPLKAFIDVFHEDWQALPLASKLAKIAGAMENVPKKGFNKNQQYKFARETDLVASVRPYLAAAGILLTFSLTEHEILPRPNPDAKGMLTRVRLHWVATDGKESIEGDMDGYGMDAGDKGVYKAVTGAKKYILMTLFLIDTGDDPEADTKTDVLAAGGPRPYRRPAPRGGFLSSGSPNDDDDDDAAAAYEAQFSELTSEDTGWDEGPQPPPVIGPSNRTDVQKGGRTVEATSTQRARLLDEVRVQGWSALVFLNFIREELHASLVDAPEGDQARLRTYIRDLLDHMTSEDMGVLLMALGRGE